MRYVFLFFLSFLFFSLQAQTQGYSTKNKKAIELYEQGQQLILHRKFYEAINVFQQAAEKDKNFVEAYIAAAGCYRILRDDANVKLSLLTAFSIEPTIPGATYEYYYLGSLFLKDGDYKNAGYYLDKFLSFNPTDARVVGIAKKMKESCVFAQEAMKNPLTFSPEALPPPLNQFQNQYFPSFMADGKFMLYTVRNATGMQDEENLYFSTKTASGWNEPQQISPRINTKENEGASSISGDGKTLVYTYCTPRNGCDLYITRKVGNEWLQPGGIGTMVNTSGWESHPCLSADGRTLYFSSNRTGGYGREDIWMTQLDSTDNWSKPVNLGPKINTPESDFTPFIHANGKTLYFASRGWPGMGGADLFISEKKGDSAWTEPRNLGYPLNSFADEMGITVSSDFSRGYFSKDVINQFHKYSSTLYTFEVPASLKSEIICVYLKGKVVDDLTNVPVKARIELVNLKTNKTDQNVVADGQTGDYLIVIPDKKNYGLFVSATGYLYKSLHFNTEDEKMTSNEAFEIRLTPIKANSSAALRNLFFESGKYDLDETSTTELNKLAKLIKDNNLKVEISGHTDAVGSAKDNQLLSEKRAQAVYTYLIAKNERLKSLLTFKGFGSQKPIGDNTTEEGKKQNRRIEIKILN